MTQTREWVTRLATIAVISGTAGLAVHAQTASVRGEHVELSVIDAMSLGDITGTWTGTFQLDSAWQLQQRASSRAVPARIQFAAVGDATPTTSSPRSVHRGTFDIDFSRFGFTLSTQEALGWSVTADSIRAVLNPTVDRGLVEVHGAFRGDAIVGTWRYVADPAGARGVFTLRRSGR